MFSTKVHNLSCFIGLDKCARRTLSSAVFLSNEQLRKLSKSQVFIQNRTMVNQAIANKFQLPNRFRTVPTRPWSENAELISQYHPIDLAEGYTDYAVPKYVTDALASTITGSNILLNQYTRGFGHGRLIQALSQLYGKLLNREINPIEDVLVTCGAYEALYLAIQGHIDTDDEVILIEPYFDRYDPMIKIAGGVPKYVSLKRDKPSNGVESSANWVIDKDELESLFSEKTKMIILNNPNNPLGKVFSRSELNVIADLCRKHNVLCVADETYEWLVHNNAEHIRMCSLPDMWDRTITIGSAGAAFSVSGWRIGWTYGPSKLLHNLRMVHQNSVYTVPTPLQEAVAILIENELRRFDTNESSFNTLAAECSKKCNYLVKVLESAGLDVIVPQGGYFLVADWSKLESKVDLSNENDPDKGVRFTKWLIKHVGVQAVPLSVFCSEEHQTNAENLIRFCFMKKDENLKTAGDALEKWVQS